MVASITFRLKSGSHVGTIDMEGSVMSCRDAQQAIALKLCAPPEEINIFHAGSTALLHPDEDLPAYAVVDVVRQSYTGRPTYLPRPKYNPLDNMPLPSASSGFGGAGPLGSADGQALTEEERLVQLQAEAALDTGIDEVSTRFRRGGYGGRGGGYGRGGMGGGGGGGPGGAGGGGDFFGAGRGRGDALRANMEENFRPPPKGYICHNCGKGGHLIQHCPSAKGGKTMKVLSFPVGIPESMLVECTMDDPAPKFITRDHRLVKRRVDPSVFTAISVAGVTDDGDSGDLAEMDVRVPETGTAAEGAPGSAASGTGGSATTSPPPASAASAAANSADAALLCAVHHGVARDAMKLPCCGALICEGCFTKMAEEALDETRSLEDMEGGAECPSCKEPLIMDEVVPATEEREKIKQLLLERKRER